MIIVVIAGLIAVVVAAALTFGTFARSESWRATVTPLASIIGSGFLICGPLLAKEFGSLALGAMALLLLLSYAVGWVIRFNIIHVENLAPTLAQNDRFAWAMRVAQGTLALAYAVSVAYYLKLLAEFLMKPLNVSADMHSLVANAFVTVIIMVITALTFSGDIKKIEHAAHGSVSVKLGIIAGMLAALGIWWAMHPGGSGDPLPPAKLSFHSIPMLLGLLITVQGFETSRYLGEAYDQHTRVKTMRWSQWISSAIYLAFLALLTPFLGRAQYAEGVAGILDIMELVAPFLGIFVLIGAVSSQLSAAIADSIGAGGIAVEVSQRRLGVRGAFIAVAILSIAIVWLTNPFEVVALSSRAFALFYAMQAGLAVWVSRRTDIGGTKRQVGFAIIGIICLIAAAAGAPAEG
jgi:hypothetical protein